MQTNKLDYSHGPYEQTDEIALDFSADACLNISAQGAAGERLDRFLAARLPEYSRTRLQKWIAMGAVHCDTQLRPAKSRLTGIEQIAVLPQPIEAEQAFIAEPVSLNVVAADRDLYVIDKPAGLVVHPAPGNWRGTLLNGLLHLDPALAALPRAGIVHRLDKDTSGLMVVARTEAARMHLIEQLASRSMSRRYLALAAGTVAVRGHVESAIGRDRSNRLRMAVVDTGQGRPARTDYRRLASGQIADQQVTLVECRLHTGRTHQIRVHLSSIAHPIVGDGLYRGPVDDSNFPRQMLHAWRLALIHPVSAQPMCWRSAVPPDFDVLLGPAGLAVDESIRQPENWDADD